MDFIQRLPLSSGSINILVVVDGLNKYAHFLHLKASLHCSLGVEIVRGQHYEACSHFWRELLKALGIKLNYSTAYHPQTDRPK